MENLNAEQIKKALTVHSHIKHPTMVDCSACAYIWSESCQEVLATDALSLINSQEQRIKELEAETKRLESLCVSKDIIIGDLSKENERLRGILLQFTDIVHKWGNKNGYDTTEISLVSITYEANKIKSQIEADTVRKMQERLKDGINEEEYTHNTGYLIWLIGQIANEMLEGKDEIRD